MRRNGRPFDLAGYRAMLERDFTEIPDLSTMSNCRSASLLMSRAGCGSTAGPGALFLGSAVNGTRTFAENVLLTIPGRKDRRGLWSIIDRAAIDVQL